jgi:putative membrane protein
MKTSLMLALGLAAALLATPASAQSSADKSFIKEAIQGNLIEVQMGQLAQKNGASDEVKNFGKMLETDHSQANTKATQVAEGLKVAPPTEPSAKQKHTYDQMAKLTGAKFDREFATHMITDHKHDIAKFEKASKSKDQTVASFASETLPTLEKHLKAAQSISQGRKTSQRQ